MKTILSILITLFSFSLIAQTATEGKMTEKTNSKGIVVEKGALVKGKKSGTWSYFYDDGVISLSSNYENGKLEGESIRYDLKGNIIAILTYKAGQLTGQQSYYYTTDKILSKGNMINGKEDGTWTFYSPTGDKIGFVKYKNGVQLDEQTKK